jgi:alkanesulfonate monooxygenase SsuD/methylene tetrahydromethanopterin reductase-like flavin-dependent oxidoreductase (luciferase family)
LSQHFRAETPYLQPVPLFARLIPEAGQMALVSAVLLAPLYPAVLLAEELATLDILAEGRLIAGVGLGYLEKEFTAFGVARGDVESRLTEFIHSMRSAWSGDLSGDSDAASRQQGEGQGLRSVQRPGVPLWIGGNSTRGIRLAATLGDEWLAPPELDVAALRRRGEEYLSLLPDTSDSAGKLFPVIREAYVGSTRREAERVARGPLFEKYRQYHDRGYYAGEVDELFDRTFILGDVESCKEKLTDLVRATGTSYVAVRMQWAGVGQADTLSSIYRFGEVISGLRRATRSPAGRSLPQD